MKESDKPMILYKYLTVEKADEWLIKENSILLTPPIYLNDLLEFRVRREPADLEEKRQMFEQFQKELRTPLSFEEYYNETNKQGFLDRESVELREMFGKNVGVLSLSSDPVNELMWAHYSLNSGVAIGYLSDDVEENKVFRCSFMPLGEAIEVSYDDLVTPIKKDFSDAVTQLSKKRKCWSYEKEWRIIKKLSEVRKVTRGLKTYYALDAKRQQIAHVVFGANAEADFIDRVKNWLGDVPAQTQKVTINHRSHELELSDI